MKVKFRKSLKLGFINLPSGTMFVCTYQNMLWYMQTTMLVRYIVSDEGLIFYFTICFRLTTTMAKLSLLQFPKLCHFRKPSPPPHWLNQISFVELGRCFVFWRLLGLPILLWVVDCVRTHSRGGKDLSSSCQFSVCGCWVISDDCNKVMWNILSDLVSCVSVLLIPGRGIKYFVVWKIFWVLV